MTRLLFITQKIDKDDDLLGVYHQWVAKLAEKVEKISVICLYRGRLELPDNVLVYSLGKEKSLNNESRILPLLASLAKSGRRARYILRFYKYIWSLRKEYDVVFVHMNPEYVILGAKLWKLLGKKIFLWYNHPLGGVRARLAVGLSDAVFHTSPMAFVARYKKARQMPVGIDTDLFHRIPEIDKKSNSILYVGRLSPIKKLEILLEAADILAAKNFDFFLTIIGEPSKSSEIFYAEKIKNKAEPLVTQGKIEFIRSIPNYKTPELYNRYELSVNMTPSGSFDKTLIESMACETPVIASNQSLRDILPEKLMFEEGNAKELADRIESFFISSLDMKKEIGTKLREIAFSRHGLQFLIDRLFFYFK